MNKPIIAIKVDVDTERGTRIGVPNLLNLFEELEIPATFLFSLGPDNTGRALKRIFKRGFLKKVSRTNVLKLYGIRTLLNGILWPGPHIGKRHATIMRLVKEKGHETGIHCYDHTYWQDNIHNMTDKQVYTEFENACNEYYRIFNEIPQGAGAPGWQANTKSLFAYDKANLLYGSDTRGEYPFYPKIKNQMFKTLQIPTTLPTLDELLGLPEYPVNKLTSYYLQLLKTSALNVFTTHAEIEGMSQINWFREFLTQAKKEGIQFCTLATIANNVLANSISIPVCHLIQGSIPGRSGHLAIQQ
ncbi:MAG: putative 4-deoxy-4-formamido-L-arabinose-phosphoundecaprenol deformylase ArnD [Legionellaceae bacterium]